MKAVYFTKYGTSEVLNIKDIEVPIPEEDELLIKVHATTFNRTDCAIISGPFLMRLFTGLLKPGKSVPGTDFAGQVVKTGKNVTRFRAGDKVFGFDDMGLLSMAQYMVIREDKAIAHIPGDISFNEAVASLEGVHYAINFINKVKILPGQKVLVNGATGAIGSALVQLLKTYNASVTATCHGVNREKVKSLGADKVIDFTIEDFTRDNERYDYVFDAAGKSTFGACKVLLKEKGIYISSELGPMAQNPFLALFTMIKGGKKVVFPIPFDIKASISLISDLIVKGKFRPLIDRTYNLDKIRDAYTYTLSGQKVGNVIIGVND
jgi:NADPH:quinone reductase-like Zn-dependent oxidoreductase